eukprot:SAG22_NODE_1553_length_4141_cov_2.014349_2_plen_270_part_00
MPKKAAAAAAAAKVSAAKDAADDKDILHHIDVKAKRISVVAANRTHVAKVLSKTSKHAAVIEEIDLTENELTALPKLAGFTALKALILDKNNLTDLDKLPKLPTLQNLWLNGNNVTDLAKLISVVQSCCPNLKYLSVLSNPCVPDFLNSKSEDNMQDYQLFRYFVLSQLPTLTFLDFQPVTKAEIAEAKRRGKFAVAAKPTASGGGAAADATGSGRGSTSEVSADVADVPDVVASGGGDHEARTYLGFNPYNYLGRESEGNRFISDTEL